MSSALSGQEELPYDYASCFCEENCYKLVERLASRQGSAEEPPINVLFISSKSRATPIWCQRSSAKKGECVLWDYHVVVLCGGDIFDLDSTLPFPSNAREYINAAFRPSASLPPEHKQLFRIVPGKVYLQKFSSDRSHMVKSGKPFPSWQCIRGIAAASDNDLQLFLDIDEMISVEELLASLPA